MMEYFCYLGQLMKDNFNLALNKYNKFEKEKKNFYYEISYYNIKEPNKIIKQTKVLKTQNSHNFDF